MRFVVQGIGWRITQRAPDWRDSAAFSGFFYAQAESCSQAESTLRPPVGNASRWLAYGRMYNIEHETVVEKRQA
jgi:hypothetical protein